MDAGVHDLDAHVLIPAGGGEVPRRDPHQTLVLLLLRDRTARHQKVGRRESLRAPARFRSLRQGCRANQRGASEHRVSGLRPGVQFRDDLARPHDRRGNDGVVPDREQEIQGFLCVLRFLGDHELLKYVRQVIDRGLSLAAKRETRQDAHCGCSNETRPPRAFLSRPRKGMSLGSRETPVRATIATRIPTRRRTSRVTTRRAPRE